MKLAFMSFSCPELTFKEAVQLAARLGYDGLEPRMASGHRHGVETDTAPEALSAYADIARSEGVAVACLATGLTFSDPATSGAHIDAARRAIDAADALGARCIRVFGGQFPDAMSREDAISHTAEAFTRLSDAIAGARAVVCMETHDAWCDPDHVAEVMRRVGRDNIAVNWDIMHPVLTAGRTIEDAYRALKPWVRHMHVHDGVREAGTLTLLPIGSGRVDHAAAMALVKRDGYSGFISGEWINWDYADHLSGEIKTLRALIEGA